MDSRLFMLEGLPGTGKSTNSYLLLTQFARHGRPVKWVHEVARPHPASFFDEASLTYEEYRAFLDAYPEAKHALDAVAMFRKSTVGIDLLEIEWNHLHVVGQGAYHALRAFDVWNVSLDRYIEIALEKWKFFVKRALGERGAIYVLDSSIFQYQIFRFLLQNAPYDALKEFVHRLLYIVKPLRPTLIYFYRDSAEATIDYLEKTRGVRFMEGIWERDQFAPYYRDKPQGAEGHRWFLRDYADIAQRLYDAADCRKACIEISEQDWASYEERILSFAGIKRMEHFDGLPPDGMYRNDALDATIFINGLAMKDPDGKVRTLIPKGGGEFFVECLPAVLRFDDAGQIVIAGGQILARWTTLGTTFVRTESE